MLVLFFRILNIYVQINISVEMYLLFIAARVIKEQKEVSNSNNRVMPVWVSFTSLNLHSRAFPEILEYE